MDTKEVLGAIVSAVNSTCERQHVDIVTYPVPGDGPESIHSFNPLVPSERPAGRPTPSDLPAPPANKCRRGRSVRRLRTLSLPALGVAAGLLAFFLSLTTSRAQVLESTLMEVWSAAMTVGVEVSSSRDLGVDFAHRGYEPERDARPLGGISEGNFQLNGMDYRVSRLAYWTRSASPISPYHQQLNIHTDRALPTGAVFELDGTRFPVTAESRQYSPTAGRHGWDNPGLNWSDGDEVPVRLLVPVITAEVVETLGFHNGSSPFRVRVRFSKKLLNTAGEVFQAFAAKTAGGKVIDARRVGGVETEGEDWDIYVQPDGSSDVTIGLYTGGPCHLATQLCSKDMVKVGKWLQETRSGTWVQTWTDTTIPLLTQGVKATVVEAPHRHDGSRMFNVRVGFDAELFNSYLQVMRAFEETAGGTVVRARPVVRRDGTQDGTRWNITVRPHGSGDVTLDLKTGGPCWNVGQPCSKDRKWVTDARDFPLTISARRSETTVARAPARSFPSWILRAGSSWQTR